eukprot:CAMPEP_0197517796 /NCGR_PEP_ID=MMETSP1318-20131121/2874_1 /TAXON_ID=552666 /ORGANISM="Partenskyella glossopodia, Strain RCC365" /LENGTH=166 /DNA_ID=CAMNT_0043067645 /DNA_START=1 /DNA_END=501 /DNA_ORIENTATION=-
MDSNVLVSCAGAVAGYAVAYGTLFLSETVDEKEMKERIKIKNEARNEMVLWQAMGNAPLNTGGNDGFDLKKLEESKSLYRDMDLDSRKINKAKLAAFLKKVDESSNLNVPLVTPTGKITPKEFQVLKHQAELDRLVSKYGESPDELEFWSLASEYLASYNKYPGSV